MKKLLLPIPIAIVLLTLTFSFNKTERKERIKIRGSETLYPLCKRLIDNFHKIKPSDFDLKSEGSEIGIAALKRQNTEIALSSRPLNVGEKIYFQEANIKYEEKIIAYDALTLIVNPHNPVDKLDKDQIAGIFTGKITNWKELGGEDHEIYVYSRDPNSGTYHFFNNVFLNNTTPAGSVVPVAENFEIMSKVKGNKYAISYIGLGYLNQEVKGVSVSMDKINYEFPSNRNVQTLKYPVIRPLYLYYLSENERLVEGFVRFALSPKGQEIVLKDSYIPIKNYENRVSHLIATPF